MIKKIKDLLIEENEVTVTNDRDTQLNSYITFKARDYLKGYSGVMHDSVVLGWARHFYIESQEFINKEINAGQKVNQKPDKVVKPVVAPKQDTPKPTVTKPTVTKPTIFDFGAM